MSTELGAISSYTLAVQEAGLAAVRANHEMTQALVEMLTELTQDRSISISSTHGQNVDVSI